MGARHEAHQGDRGTQGRRAPGLRPAGSVNVVPSRVGRGTGIPAGVFFRCDSGRRDSRSPSRGNKNCVGQKERCSDEQQHIKNQSEDNGARSRGRCAFLQFVLRVLLFRNRKQSRHSAGQPSEIALTFNHCRRQNYFSSLRTFGFYKRFAR